MKIRAMEISDYEEVFALWQVTSKRALSDSDSRENIEKYLKRNEGLSKVAAEDGKIVGTLLAGHDGRRGFFYHMAVLPQHRRKGIAKALVEAALSALADEGIEKTHIFTYFDNYDGQAFWSTLGWEKRNELYAYSQTRRKGKNG